MPREQLGDVIGGRTDEYMEVKLRADLSSEDVPIGTYVMLKSTKYSYLSKVVRIYHASRERGIVEERSSLKEFRRKGISIGPEPVRAFGSPLYTVIDVEPLKTINPEKEIGEAQTLPGILCDVFRADAEELGQFFDFETEQRSMGHFKGVLGMADAFIDIEDSQRLHTGIFAKTGAGKTYLAKILAGHITAREKSALLIFDMHSEYGYHRDGLKKIFPEKTIVFTIDHNSRRKDEDIRIPYKTIQIDDIQHSIELTPAQNDALYLLAREFGEDWLQHLLEDSLDSLILAMGGQRTNGQIREGRVKRTTLLALVRKIDVQIHHIPAISSTWTHDSVETILNAILGRKTIIVDFGQFRNNPDVYAFITSILVRRLFELYQLRFGDRDDAAETLPLLSIMLEEAHKFLDKQHVTETFFGKFIREARKFNMGLIVIDQRPSQIYEEVMSQIGTMFIMQLTNAKDMRAVIEGSEEGLAEYRDEIRRLARQEALIVGRAVPFPISFRTHNFNFTDLLPIWGVKRLSIEEKKQMMKDAFAMNE